MARALWKGAISFGLVTIPVSLYPAKDSRESIAFHMLHKDDLSRVHNKRVDEQDHEVPFEDLVKGYEYEKGRYVVIGEEDLKAANVAATQSIDIMHFVDASEIDVAYYDTPYYTEPSKAGRKAYALLRDTLKRTGKVGVAKLVIRERQHLCLVMADGLALLACTIRWPYQLRDASEFDLPGKEYEVSDQELKMAEQLVETMATAWQPGQYHDTYHDDLMKLIDQKVSTGRVTEASEVPVQEKREAKVVDIMTLLRRSMEQQQGAGAGKAASGGAAAAGGTGHTRGARKSASTGAPPGRAAKVAGSSSGSRPARKSG